MLRLGGVEKCAYLSMRLPIEDGLFFLIDASHIVRQDVGRGRTCNHQNRLFPDGGETLYLPKGELARACMCVHVLWNCLHMHANITNTKSNKSPRLRLLYNVQRMSAWVQVCVKIYFNKLSFLLFSFSLLLPRALYMRFCEKCTPLMPVEYGDA